MAWFEFVYQNSPMGGPGPWELKFRKMASKFSQQVDSDSLFADAFQNLSIKLEKLPPSNPRDPRSVETEKLITTIFKHELINEYNRIVKKYEARSWLKAVGPLGELLFEYRCRRKWDRQAILEQLPGLKIARDGLFSSSAELMQHARKILAHRNWSTECDRHATESFDGAAEAGVQLESGEASPEQQLSDSESGDAISLFALLVSEDMDEQALAAKFASLDLKAFPQLDTADLYILRAQFSQGLSVRLIAEHLKIKDHKVRYRSQVMLEELQRWMGNGHSSLDDFLSND